MNIQLVHSIAHPPTKVVGFYDGHLIAYNGVLTIPFHGEQSFRWARQAYMNGYNRFPDGRTFHTWQELEMEIYRILETPQIEGSAESAEQPGTYNTKGLDTWRQPATEHRIRASESSSRKPVQKAGVAGGVRRRTDKGSAR